MEIHFKLGVQYYIIVVKSLQIIFLSLMNAAAVLQHLFIIKKKNTIL